MEIEGCFDRFGFGEPALATVGLATFEPSDRTRGRNQRK
jgi:hypothetical protein